MTKQPIRVVPSDDYMVMVDGIEYHPHEGETVSVAGSFGMEDLSLMVATTGSWRTTCLL